MFFHIIIFSYYLTSTQNLTVGYIKRTPDYAFTYSFLDILFVQYFRQEMSKTLTSKIRNESDIASFRSEILPMVPCTFREKLETGV